MLFGTGLGSEGPIYFLLFAGCFNFVWFAGFVAAGVIVLVKARPRWRWLGSIVCALAFVVPVGCYLAPGIQFRQQYGRDPLPCYPKGVIQYGMSKEQVLAKLGDPYGTYTGGDLEIWHYHHFGTFGQVEHFGVYFDANGSVESIGGD
jgi:hypothetical protein